MIIVIAVASILAYACVQGSATSNKRQGVDDQASESAWVWFFVILIVGGILAAHVG